METYTTLAKHGFGWHPDVLPVDGPMAKKAFRANVKK